METTPFRFAISATFTAEPLDAVLRFWAGQLGAEFEIRFADYNQVRQTLAHSGSVFGANRHGLNAVLARVEDLADFDWNNSETLARIRTNFKELVRAFEVAGEHSSVPMVFVLCPPSPAFLADIDRAQLATELAASVPFALKMEPLQNIASPEGEKLGRIPYTDLFFSALGTALVRYADSVTRPPFKVIALDCDNTLWNGICGEDGPTGIKPDLLFQRFLVEQHQAGMLLVMASKNNEQDVLETFRQNPTMPLELHHFAAWRLNWDSKAANLRSLADELSLGLDSFIFVDDNAKEIAEMEESAPEVVSLISPLDLPRVWVFDRAAVTEEDRKRNQAVAQGQEFGRELKNAGSLEHFIETLNLRLTFGVATQDRLPRIAQLTQRTNQFNFTTIRRTEAQLMKNLANGLECLTVEVADRFGEYGLTGVVLYRVANDELHIDTFLLSCRVLGRGVEHQVLARVANEALSRGAETVILPLVPTNKNRPAQEFYETVGEGKRSARELLSLRWSAAQVAAPALQTVKMATHKRPHYQSLALSAEQVLRTMQTEAVTLGAVDPSLTETERTVAVIWASLLSSATISASSNFFDLGGHSLLMVQMVMRVREAFGVELKVDDVYSATLTLSDLARKIERYQSGDSDEYQALLREIEAMSDEEVARLLAEEASA